MTVFEINGHFVRMAWRRKNSEHVAGLYVPIEYRGYGKGKNMMIGVDCLLGSILGSENSLRSVKLYHFPPESLLPSHQGASFIPTRKLLPFPPGIFLPNGKLPSFPPGKSNPLYRGSPNKLFFENIRFLKNFPVHQKNSRYKLPKLVIYM